MGSAERVRLCRHGLSFHLHCSTGMASENGIRMKGKGKTCLELDKEAL
jgi:hypothetical protein